jgi:spore coat polysaccharide biosynthesis protein SpsF (cytidylyltransferase family)
MSSSRLPGKTLADIGGEPALALLLKRLERARSLTGTIVATSTDPIDDAIAELASDRRVGVARGPRDDVLARIVLAIGDRPGPVVRITGDCPLLDPEVVDAAVELFLATPGCAYASNVEPRGFPDGLDVEVVDADALRAVAREDLSRSEREHVTAAIRSRPERFPPASLRGTEQLGSLRWTVDDAEDLAFVRAVVDRLGARRYAAGIDEVLSAVRSPPSLASFGGARRG